MRKENSSKYKSKIKPLVIKLNNFTTFTFYILRKNAFKKDPYDKWCRVYINIKNTSPSIENTTEFIINVVSMLG